MCLVTIAAPPTSTGMADGGTHQRSRPLVYRVVDEVSVSGVAWVVLIALAAADIVLTLVGRRACFSEQNPFARWIIHSFGPAGLVALKGVALAILAVVMWQLPVRYERAAFGGFGITQFVAVGWNTTLLLSQTAICGA